MTGEAHWLTLALLGLGAIGILVLLYFASRLDWRFRLTRRKLECPVHHEQVDITAIRDEKTGQLTSVQSCSHFIKPGEVTCAQGCLRTANAPGSAGSSPASVDPKIAAAQSRS